MTGRVRIGAYALALNENRMLLVRIAPGYPSAGSWTLPGGGLEFGESPEAGLHRELAEETALQGSIDGIVGINSVLFPVGDRRPEPIQGIRIVYSVTCAGDPMAEESGSTDLAEWIPIEQVFERNVIELVTWTFQTADALS